MRARVHALRGLLVGLLSLGIVSATVVAANNAANSPARSSGGGTVSSASAPLVITTGNMALSAATTSTAGSQSAADKALATFQQADWKNVFFQSALAHIPTLNRFKSIPLGQATQGSGIGAVTNDGACEGGGMGWASAFKMFGVQLFKTPKTGVWGFGFDIFLPAPANATSAQAGLSNVAGAHTILVKTDFAVDATHYVISINGTATVTNVVASGTTKTVWFEADATNVKAYIEGTLVATTAQSTLNSDEAMYPYAFESGASLGCISEIAWSYVRN